MNSGTVLLLIALMSSVSFAQTKEAYDTDNGSSASKKGLLDPSRFSMQNSLSFGMASYSGESNLKSQSLYTTMLQYQFNAPVTVNLNFGLPIHSTVSSARNLNYDNLKSLDYFKSMPVSASLRWQPTQNMLFQVNIEKNTYNNYYNSGLFPWYSNYYRGSIFDEEPLYRKESEKPRK